jgi:hypothetical protein
MSSKTESKRQMPPSKIRFYFKDGAIIHYEGPNEFKEVAPEPKQYHVRNRPGHVRPLRRRRK